MSGGDIFYLDEEGDKDLFSPSSSQTSSSSQQATSVSPPAPSSTLQIPAQPTPQISQPFGRKSGVFAATPSFPSPLAQAITVPSHSDSSSTASSTQSSPHVSDDEQDMQPLDPGIPPRRAGSSASKARSASSPSESTSPSSSRRSLSRPSSPSQGRQALTPGALLMNRVKRSGSASMLSGPPSVSLKSSPPHKEASKTWRDTSPNRSRQGSTSGSSGRGALSETNAGGSSPLAFGSPELEPASDPIIAPRPISMVSPSSSKDRDGNILGLGWAANWEGPGKDKGKGRDSTRSSSPKKELAAPIAMAGGTPRQRRASEFLRPSSMDLRKLPPPSLAMGGRGFGGSGVPTLSASASMISPLNPLPSPWSEEPSSLSSSMINELSSSATSSSGPIRLNRVPTSVRLAADLIKNSQTPPLPQIESSSATSSASMPTPNPSPADNEVQLDQRKNILGPTASLPVGALSASLSNATARWSFADNAEPSHRAIVPSPSPGATFAAPALLSPSPSVTSEPAGDLLSTSRHRRTRSSLYDAQSTQSGPATGSSHSTTFSPNSMDGASLPDDASTTSGGTGYDVATRSNRRSAFDGPGVPPRESRLRSVAQRGGLAMDLAGVSSVAGDAASHASMIIQSRQAKVQRWGPRNSFSGSMSHGPSGLSASFVDRSMPIPPRHSENEPSSGFQAGSINLGGLLSRQSEEDKPRLGGLQHPRSPDDSATAAYNSMRMERQGSATGTVGGIEWVDWYDCYKAYKAEKIRAETKAASERAGPSASTSQLPSPVAERDAGKQDTLHALAQSDLTLTPVTSRDDLTSHTSHTSHASHSGSLPFRRRSLSIRSNRSNVDHKISPNPKRSSVLERPRQSSGGSTKSNSTEALKRKKNLVTKMEGWWTAVKSNFTPEPSAMDPPQRNAHSTLYPHARVPSAPQSRRGSEKSAAMLLPPEPVRRTSSSSGRGIRPAASHMELRGVSDSYPSTFGSARNGAFAPMSAATASVLMPPPPPPAAKSGDASISRLTATRSGLETRRNQPSLRLDLEPSVLAAKDNGSSSSQAASARTQESPAVDMSSSRQGSQSRSSSYGMSAMDQLSLTSRPKDDKPVAPGADLTVSSVRQHIKQRLTAAKVQCDNSLRRIIAIMTMYEDERIAAAAQDLAEEPRRDYFDTFSDSPLLDPADSEDDYAIPPLGGSSRGPSRRGSMSLSSSGVMSSPSRRLALLSSVPASPRRSMSARRRPSIVPRVLPREIQHPRTLSIEPPHSTSSSRSTSRSRSPMPHIRPVASNAPALEQALEADKLFLTALQELIVLATDVLDLSVDSLISRPSSCVEIIQKLQKTGQYWDENDDWPGRAWYVDILMAVASLGRVLDWWEAEKGFWNFEEEAQEPLSFILRPAKECSPAGDPTPPDTVRMPSPQPGAVATSVASPPSDALSASPVKAQPQVTNATPPIDTQQAIEDLRTLAEQVKSVNIVMELSLQGEEIVYVNDAIFEVIGREPDDVLDRPIAELLAPADTSHFTEATEVLLQDDNNTVQLRFRFEVHEAEETPDDRQPGPIYIELEGVGMLIRDEDDEPSHTMWVMKPVTATRVDTITDAVFPREGVISTEGVLCRICEREIVVWFFEKHNETCDAVHRLEAEIVEIDECLRDLHQTAKGLCAEFDGTGVFDQVAPQLIFYTLPESVATDAERLAGPQGVEARKVRHEQLQEAIDVLAMGRQIESPSVQADEADLPFHLQRYLSPESEDKLLIITRWSKPPTEDRALALLFSHVEDQLRRKLKAIARMQSTIRYSEKTRHEWEDKVNQMVEDSDMSGSDSGSDAAVGDTSFVTNDSTAAGGDAARGHRRIAALARLPITQGHPQRAPDSRAEDSTPFVRDFKLTSDTGPSLAVPASVSPFGPLSPTPVPAAPTIAPIIAPDREGMSTPAPRPMKQASSPVLERVGGERKGHSRRGSMAKAIRDVPLSPRISSSVSAAPIRAPQPSIKDFNIIKPISRGAFGAVYLAKKVATGDYYAIKILKKSDMIAKNQITNVKAERIILMNQASSPHVVKLFFSFQSKDYLYLVMEYLNGGDCSTLVKTLGGLPVDWARNYTAELVLGLEYLHARNVAHRDIKPDNLLIDARGHLKLTDFGLSKIGLLNRQIGGPRPPYLKGTSLRTAVTARRASSVSSADSPILSPDIIPVVPGSSNLHHSYFPHLSGSGSADDSSGSESAGPVPKHMRQVSGFNKSPSDAGTASNSGADAPRFVGTPDYLSPESILGGGTDDRMVDWWAVGVVLYEFIYGFPPFHAETPEKVFDNVVSRRIDWHDDEIDVPAEAHDLMDRLMCTNPAQRLGARGADEVKQHAFFAGVDWVNLRTNDAIFVPDCTDPESTDYFDQRGATGEFQDEDGATKMPVKPSTPLQEHTDDIQPSPDPDDSAADDFGAFTFKNLPSLKQANDDVIRRMRSDSIAVSSLLPDGAPKERIRAHRKSNSRVQGPPSPSTSTSSAASTPSRLTQPLTPGLMPASSQHARRPSLNALNRVKSIEDDNIGRSPNRFRAGSTSSASDRSASADLWKQFQLPSRLENLHLVPPPLVDQPQVPNRSVNVLIAEDNPISQKMLETHLSRMGCQCVCVQDGPDCLAAAMGSLRFDVIICDLHTPVISGEQVARMIRSAQNLNQETPIIAATSHDQSMTEEGTLFRAVLAKPFSKPDLIRCLRKAGFVLSTADDTETPVNPA